MYFLYPRPPKFQRSEIALMEMNRTKLAIVNEIDTVDQRNDLRIGATHPQLLAYIHSRFHSMSSPPIGIDGFEFFERDCK
jgi:hypothetical protein